MKNYLLFAILLIASSGFASKTDSTFQRHQISFTITNAVSHEFLAGRNWEPTINYVHVSQVYQDGPSMNSAKYLPNYALHLQINYSIGLSKLIRIETGIGYLLQGASLSCKYIENQNLFILNGAYNEYLYQGSLTVPIHIKFTKPLHNGTFTCTLGPGFTLPVHTFYTLKDYAVNGQSQPDRSSHQAYNSQTIAYFSSIAAYLKMGYEKNLAPNITMDIGPAVNFSNLILLDENLWNTYGASRYRPFQYYIGLDVAFNFGMDDLRIITENSHH